MSTDPTTDFLLQLCATLIGVGGGLAAALWHDRKKKMDASKENRNNTIDAIIVELEDLKSGMTDYLNTPIAWDNKQADFTGEIPELTTPAFDSAIHSGNYNLLPPKLQSQLGNTYLIAEGIKAFSNQISNFHLSLLYTQRMGPIVATRICKNINQYISDMLSEIDGLIPILKKAKLD